MYKKLKFIIGLLLICGIIECAYVGCEMKLGSAGKTDTNIADVNEVKSSSNDESEKIGKIINAVIPSNSSSSSFIIDENNTLYAAGANTGYRLGLNCSESKNIDIYTKVMDNVKEVSSCSYWTLVLDLNNTLYGIGSDIIYDNSDVEAELWNPIKLMGNVRAIYANDFLSLIINDDDELYVMGDGLAEMGIETRKAYKPYKLMEDVNIAKVVGRNIAVVDNEGNGYVWGYNYNSLLGKSKDNFQKVPQKILGNVRDIEVSSKEGFYSDVYFITNENELYVLGSNGDGQLGTGDMEDVIEPIWVMDNIAQVYPGSLFTMALSTDGILYGAGNTYSMGIGEITLASYFFELMENVRDVKISGTNSYIITNDNELYVAGSNASGQLGTGDKEEITGGEPLYILDDVKDVAVSRQVGYGSYAIVVKNDGSICSAGANEFGQLGLVSKEEVLKFTKVELK